MPTRADSSIPAMPDGWGRQTAQSVWRQGVGGLRGAYGHSTFRLERASADFHVACLWSALGLTLTGLLFAGGFGAQIGQILAMAG
jgi:hypothetical protein